MDPTEQSPHLCPAVDLEVLAALRELPSESGGDALDELIDLYRRTAAGTILDMRDAIARNDPTALKRTAHRLKGASGAFGAYLLCELCQRLESLGASGNIAGAADVAAAAEAELERVYRALDLSGGSGVL